MRKSFVFLFIFLALSVDSVAGQVNVEITAPSDKTPVPERPIVEGSVTDPGATVWVIVHPLEVADYWVQPRLAVRTNGTWKVQVHIGRPGNIDIGKVFEIRAVANPEEELRLGKILPYWPKAKAISDVIEVVRK